MDLLLRQGRDGLVGGMRGERRHRPASGGNGLELGERDLVGRKMPGLGDAVEHAVARRARGLAERSGRRPSGDCGSATSSAASASDSFFGSLPK